APVATSKEAAMAFADRPLDSSDGQMDAQRGRRIWPCPPCICFNCLLPEFQCCNFSICNQNTGKCGECPTGFTGENCALPLCTSLPVRRRQPPAKPGRECVCDQGWTGANCNVCSSDKSCASLLPSGVNGTCYTGGIFVKQHFKSCSVGE